MRYRILALLAAVCVALLALRAPRVTAAPPPDETRAMRVSLEDVPVTSTAPVLTSAVSFPSLYRAEQSVRVELLVVCHGTGSVVAYNLLDSNGAEIGGAPVKLNSGTAQTADCAYTYTISVAKGQRLNLEFATSTRASFSVEEVR